MLKKSPNIPSKFKKEYESYKSVWETKEVWRIKDEIWMVETWSRYFDKWRTPEALTGELRLMALNEVLEEKVGKKKPASSLRRSAKFSVLQ